MRSGTGIESFTKRSPNGWLKEKEKKENFVRHCTRQTRRAMDTLRTKQFKPAFTALVWPLPTSKWAKQHTLFIEVMTLTKSIAGLSLLCLYSVQCVGRK